MALPFTVPDMILLYLKSGLWITGSHSAWWSVSGGSVGRQQAVGK